MAANGTAGLVRLKVALWGFIVLDAVFLVASIAYVIGAFMLAGSISHWGWGHVPHAEMQPFELSLAVYKRLAPFRNVGLVLLLFWIVFEASRAIKCFGVKPRFQPWFASLSQIIPIAFLYIPYAALGDTRKTLKSIGATGVAPPKPVRGYDAFTIWLGLATFAEVVADSGFELVARSAGKAKDTAGGLHLMSSIETTLIGETIVGLLYLAVVAAFYFGVLRLFRRALAAAAISDASGVFGDPAEPPTVMPGSATQGAAG